MSTEDTLLLHFDDEREEASRLARAAGLEVAEIERHRFPDDELRLRLPAELPANRVLFRSLHRPNEKLLELLLVARSAGRAGRADGMLRMDRDHPRRHQALKKQN